MQKARRNPSMLSLKKLDNKAVFYTRANPEFLEDYSIENQIEKAKSFAVSQGLKLDQIFIDNPYIINGYHIKDRAFPRSQNIFPPRRLFMPQLVPILKEPAKVPEKTAFQRMLDYIHENPVNVILTSKLEKLFENLKDLFVFVNFELNPRNIGLHTLTEDFNSRSKEGKQFLKILDSFYTA